MNQIDVSFDSNIEILKQSERSIVFKFKDKGSWVVRKQAGNSFISKLMDEVIWYQKAQKLDYVPKLLNCRFDSNAYYYEIPYVHSAKSLSSVLNSKFYGSSEQLVLQIINSLYRDLYSHTLGFHSRDEVLKYLTEKLLEKTLFSISKSTEVQSIFDYKYLIVNGRELKNFQVIYNELVHDELLLDKISREKKCTIHGDLTLENILIEPGKWWLIDPNGENYISSPVVDLAKLMQSIHSCYEELDLCTIQVMGNRIEHQAPWILNRNKNLVQLITEICIEQGGSEQELFLHEAIHFSRLLPYKIKANPSRSGIYYIRLIELLNLALGKYS